MTYAKNINNVKSVSNQLYGQVPNTQGYYVYQITPLEQLARFLVLGTTAPTYHAGDRNIEKNVDMVQAIVKTQGVEVVKFLLDFDNQNIAPKREPLLFVLAYCLKNGDEQTRKAASEAAKTIVRTGRDIRTFTSELSELGGWGRLTKRTIAEWYLRENTPYQVIKYRNSNHQYNHRNIMRLAHPKPTNEEQSNLFAYLVGKPYNYDELPKQVRLFEYVNSNSNQVSEEDVIRAIVDGNLTHEMIPTQFRKSPNVWAALIKSMNYRALVWNLGTLSELGLLTPMSKVETIVLKKLQDDKAVIGSRIHPFTMLVAIRNYATGKGERKTWPVNQRIVSALEKGLGILYNNVRKTDARLALIVDVSGSMSSSYGGVGHMTKNRLSGSNITPIEGAGAMAAIQCRSSNAYVIGVDNRVHPLEINDRSTISSVTNTLKAFRGGCTHLSVGIEHLIKERIQVDAVVYYTDNEVNGGYQISQLFEKYRKEVSHNAKLIVVGFEANEFTIGDSNTPWIINICGFDSGTIDVINAFAETKL